MAPRRGTKKLIGPRNSSAYDSCPFVLRYEVYDALCSTLEMSRLGLMSLPFGNALLQHGATSAGREGRPMRQFKDLNACIGDLEALRAGSDIGPEQKRNVEAAIEQLRRLRRKPNPKPVEVYRCIREVASQLVMAFLK